MFKMHMEGLPANVANTVRVSSSLVPGEWYSDEASTSSPDFESACWSVMYEADFDKPLSTEAKDLILQSLGINAVLGPALAVGITTQAGDSLQTQLGSPRLIAVDANRDGRISFGGPEDLTTRDRPYRFWVNDDCDVYTPNGTQDDVFLGAPQFKFGYQFTEIPCTRDLEDWSRIRIKAPPGYDPRDADSLNWDIKVSMRDADGPTSVKFIMVPKASRVRDPFGGRE